MILQAPSQLSVTGMRRLFRFLGTVILLVGAVLVLVGLSVLANGIKERPRS